MRRRKTKHRKKKTPGQLFARKLVAAAKERARLDNLEFKLTKKDERWIGRTIDNGKCQLTGLNFDLKGGPYGPSLDRICCVSTVASDKSYSRANCRIILWAVNCSMNRWGQIPLMQIMGDSLRARATLWWPQLATLVTPGCARSVAVK